MLTSIPILNIPIIPDDAFGLNQVHLAVTSPSSYKAANICLNICKEENKQDPLRLNVSYILTNTYGKNQANNIFHWVL